MEDNNFIFTMIKVKSIVCILHAVQHSDSKIKVKSNLILHQVILIINFIILYNNGLTAKDIIIKHRFIEYSPGSTK